MPAVAEPATAGLRAVFEVTEACQNACLHCYNPWRGTPRTRARTLTRREWVRIARAIRGDAPLAQVVLSGGEPLLYPEAPELVQDLVDEGLDTAVITNGERLDAALLGRFPPDTLFEVTLFAADRALHDRLAGAGRFEAVLRSLVEIERRRCRLVLVVVITSLNAHDIRRTLQLGIALGAQGVLLNRINLTRRSFARARHLVPTPEQLRGALRDADDIAAERRIGVAVSVPVPPCVVDPAEFAHLHFGWCPRGGAGSYVAVGPAGMLRACNHTSRVLGDLRRRSFAELMETPSAELPWSSSIPPICARCRHPLASECAGGCPAAAQECHGRNGAVDPFVTLACAAGRERSEPAPRPLRLET